MESYTMLEDQTSANDVDFEDDEDFLGGLDMKTAVDLTAADEELTEAEAAPAEQREEEVTEEEDLLAVPADDTPTIELGGGDEIAAYVKHPRTQALHKDTLTPQSALSEVKRLQGRGDLQAGMMGVLAELQSELELPVDADNTLVTTAATGVAALSTWIEERAFENLPRSEFSEAVTYSTQADGSIQKITRDTLGREWHESYEAPTEDEIEGEDIFAAPTTGLMNKQPQHVRVGDLEAATPHEVDEWMNTYPVLAEKFLRVGDEDE